MKNFDQLNRETFHANNYGNQHHPTAGITPLTSKPNFDRLNKETYCHNNKMSLSDYYNSSWKKW